MDIIEKRKQYYIDNKDRILQRNKQYYYDNKEVRQAYNNEYWSLHGHKYTEERSKSIEYKKIKEYIMKNIEKDLSIFIKIIIFMHHHNKI